MAEEIKMTDLDKRLREIAALNWPQFVALVGEDVIIKAKICLMRKSKASYGQISVKLGVTERVAQYNCSKCDH
jgi:hypothetical protein